MGVGMRGEGMGDEKMRGRGMEVMRRWGMEVMRMQMRTKGWNEELGYVCGGVVLPVLFTLLLFSPPSCMG